jgi:peptide-methionine (S)-S-oxide reductase
MFLDRLLKKSEIPARDSALQGRDIKMPVAPEHYVTGNPMQAPWPAGYELAMFGMGCFWGVERKFWQQAGVYSTQAGYAAGYTPNPAYEEVCSGQTGHNEVVQVVFDPAQCSYENLLNLFWENHDPTQGMRQGNDMGTQYRSGIYAFNQAQLDLALTSKQAFEPLLKQAGYPAITTEIIQAPEFYYAEDYHQQYLAKNPNGYCGMGGTGVMCPTAS